MAALKMNSIPSEDHCGAARTDLGATSTRSEQAILGIDGKPEEVAAAAVGLLAVLYSKWRSARNEFATYIGTKAGLKSLDWQRTPSLGPVVPASYRLEDRS